MSCVHYKFKSAVNYETVTFDGMQISVADLKKAIIQQKKMGKLMENFDLQLTKPQSTEVYKDADLIPKNSSVVVARIPVERVKTRSWEPSRVDMSTAQSAQKLAEAHERQRKAADLVNMPGSEEDKVKMMIQQSGKEYSQTNYAKPRYPTGPPPRHYVCHRCGQPGHFINSCPHRDEGEMMPRVKRSTGIPNSFMTPCLDPHAPGVLLTNSGQLAVPTIDAMAYKQGKKEKPPFVKSDSPERKQEEKIIPGELLCPVCKDLLTDAVVAPCCGNSSCDECIRDSLLDSDDHVCPLCKETGISPDALIPNKFMRTAVNNFQNETGYTTVKRRNQQQEEAPVVAPPPKVVPKPAQRPEPERHSSAIPAHLVGMPPQVIKAAQAEMASKEAYVHPDGRLSSGPSYHSAQTLPPGYVFQNVGTSQQPSNAVQSMAVFSAPYSVAHYQQAGIAAHSAGMSMTHAVANLSHSSQGNQGGHRQPVSTVYIDQHGVPHTMPQMRLAHPGGRPWSGPVTRGILVQGRGGQRMIFRPSGGARRLGPPPSSGDHRFSAPAQPDHRFPPPQSQVVGPISPNQIPGHAMPQGVPPSRPPSQQQAPPGMTAPMPGVIRMPTQMQSGGPPPPQMVFNRGPPPAGQVPRLMGGPEMMMGPPPGFIPPLIAPTGGNMPPPVPLTEEEFYREKERLLELERKKKSQEAATTAIPTTADSTVSRKRADPMDDFEELLQKKNRSKAAAAPAPFRSRSRSPRSRSRSFTKSRSRTRSRSVKKRSRSLSRSRSRSPMKPPVRRSRSITRSRSKSRSRSRAFPRSKSRTRSPYMSRKKSFTPKRSLTPPRKYSRSRSRSPPPKRPRSRSFTRSPRPRSRTRSRSLPPRRKAGHSPMRSLTRSPPPKKRPLRSRSPGSRGRSPLPPKRNLRKSLSPRGKSRDRSRGPSQARPRPPDAGASRFTPPDRPRGGVYSSPLRYDNRGPSSYYRYPEKIDPRWTEYYRMWQDWYDKYGGFAQGFPGPYDHAGGRMHPRPMPRSRSNSPRPPKRSRSPGDPSRWRRERSPKRPRLDAKDRPTRGRGERDEYRRSPVDKAKERDRKKDIRMNSRSEKDHRTVPTESERTGRAPVKLEKRRDDERREDAKGRSRERVENHGPSRDRVEGRGRSLERHDGRGRSREKEDVRGRSREKDSLRGRSRERDSARLPIDSARGPIDSARGPIDSARGPIDSARGPIDSARGPIDSVRGPIDSVRGPIEAPRGTINPARSATANTSWDKETSEPQEEASSIPVIGAGAAVSRLTTRAPFHGNDREREEPTHEVKEETLPRDPERKKQEDQLREPAGMKQERPLAQEPIWDDLKDDPLREPGQPQDKERLPIKPEVSDDTVDLKPDLTSKEKPVSKGPGSKEPVPKEPMSKEPTLDSAAYKMAASRAKDSSSGSDRSSPRSKAAALDPAPTKKRKAEKSAAKEKVANVGRKRSSRQPSVKKKSSPSANDILIANVLGASKWESNLSDDSDLDVAAPPPRQKEKERSRTTNLPRSVLESADNAMRQKPRPSIVSAVCSPPPRSSIHRISTDSKSPPKSEADRKPEKRSHEATTLSHSRKVVQGPTSLSMKVTVSAAAAKASKVAEKSSHDWSESRSQKDPSRRGEGDSRRPVEKVRSESTRREEEPRPSKKAEKGRDASTSSASKFKDEATRRSASVRDRKASVFMDEDKFEPDYNESGSSDYEESRVAPAAAAASASQAERSRRHESSSENEEVKASKQKKRHKKQKKHKKHKSKSHKDDK